MPDLTQHEDVVTEKGANYSRARAIVNSDIAEYKTAVKVAPTMTIARAGENCSRQVESKNRCCVDRP